DDLWLVVPLGFCDQALSRPNDSAELRAASASSSRWGRRPYRSHIEDSTEQSRDRPFAVGAPSLTIVERREGHSTNQQRRHDRPRVVRIGGEDAAPLRRELE